MMWFFGSGSNGSVIQAEDGRYADTVIGDTSEAMEAHEALDALNAEAEADTSADWVEGPLFGDFDASEMADYLG